MLSGLSVNFSVRPFVFLLSKANKRQHPSRVLFSVHMEAKALTHIKTKPPDRAPCIKTDAARAPKKLTRRSLLSAMKQAMA